MSAAGAPPASDGAATSAEIASCIAVLSRLTPSALRDDPALAPLREAGVKLFGPEVLRERFGQADAIEYLRELNGHRELLKKLTRLHTEVEKAHAVRKAEAAGCGINPNPHPHPNPNPNPNSHPNRNTGPSPNPNPNPNPDQAAGCGINVQRAQRLQAIEEA